MNTSYFSKSGKNPNAVSIAYKNPPSFKGRHFTLLAPPRWLINKFKKDLNTKEYIKLYYENVLDKLDPKRIYERLGENAILLCWENKTKFCHRHIVAEWFYKHLGIKVTEL